MKPTRIWAIGDSGTATISSAPSHAAYTNYTGTVTPDFWLMLGNNAYTGGAERSTSRSVRHVPKLLHKTVVWTPSATMTPLMPRRGTFLTSTSSSCEKRETGGFPSRTERSILLITATFNSSVRFDDL